MNLSDFTLLMNSCGANIDNTWCEEDRRGINRLNINRPPQRQYIAEEIKRNISSQMTLSNATPSVTYCSYGNVTPLTSNGTLVPTSMPTRSFTPDVAINLNGILSYIELKKITDVTTINGTSQPTYPMLFAQPGVIQPLATPNYGGSAIFSTPAGTNLMTFYHEGQIFHDIARLINFRTNNERLFFGAFIFSPIAFLLQQVDFEKRLDVILSQFNYGFTQVFSVDPIGILNSWPLPGPQNSLQFTRASINGFNNGINYYENRNNYDIFAVAVELS